MHCLYICKSRHLHYSIVWNYFFFHTEKPRSSYRYMYLDWISAYYSKFLEAGVISDWFWSCLYNLKKEHQLTICKVWYELVWLHYEKKISTKSVENWLLYKQKTENTICFTFGLLLSVMMAILDFQSQHNIK